MLRTRWGKVLLVISILTLCFIWGNSMMPASVSHAFSNWFGNLLSRIFGSALTTASGRGILRKAAHFTEYMLFGAELTALIALPREKRGWALVLLAGMAAAVLDETIQLFSAGRASRVLDVWIDLGGFLTGAVLCLLILFLVRRMRAKHGHNRTV